VELKLSGADDLHVVKNLWPLYQHELSEFDASRPNRHGLFGVDDSVTTLAEHGESQNGWWEHPGVLFPYLILVDGRPAGFNLIVGRSAYLEGIDADFVVYEFFLLHAYRGQGIAERAAVEGFEAHRGRWEIVTYPTHSRAIAFWRKVVRGYSQQTYAEDLVDHVWGRKFAFRFDNAAGALDDKR
jgi:predicted acetyltransferase